MHPRPIQLHRHPAASPGKRPPLLFIHGGYTHSLCWQYNFIPYFSARGYDCHALDLSGHGASPGVERIDDFGIDDFADDLAQAVAMLPTPPVLIAHSMGTVVAQRYLERGSAAGLVLLAPVPPTGTAGSASRLALQQPEFFGELPNVISGRLNETTLRVMTAVYFPEGTPPRELLRYAPMMQTESAQAVADMVTLPLQRPRRRPELPALVIGGREDAVFPPGMLHFTALPWRARQIVIEGAGHMLMLDRRWNDTAAAVAGWLDELAV